MVDSDVSFVMPSFLLIKDLVFLFFIFIFSWTECDQSLNLSFDFC